MSHAMYPHVFAEGQVGAMTTRNRLVMSSMCDNMSGRHGEVTDQKVEYFRRKAQGGVGWINLGYSYVTQRGRGCTYYQSGIYEDDLIPGLSRLTEAVHEEGARMGCQIAHAGRQTTHHYIEGRQAEAPSPVPEPLPGETPVELSVERIAEIVQEFADAAVRAEQAGFDAIEFHGAHGYLQHAFMSLLSNKRDDSYGGSLENRLRFPRECVRAVREAVGDDFIVGYRLSGSEFLEGGITLEESLATTAMLEEERADYVHVSGGTYEAVHMTVAPQWIGPGQLEEQATAIKAATKLPVLSVGRYNSPELAERVIANGHADFIVMGRALLADPDLPLKAFEERPEDIRPCVACSQGCIDRWFSALDITCVNNPDTGREALPGWGANANEAGSPKKLLVVGAGPAGLEAARVAAEDDHDVTVWERHERAGGQLALAALPSSGGDWGAFVEWLLRQNEKLGVTVETGHEAGAEAIASFGADQVILATGARPWPEREIPGWDRPEVVDPFALLRGEEGTGRRVAVVGGGLIGCKVALFLAAQGKDVTLVGHGHTNLFTDGEREFAYDVVGEIVRALLMQRLEDAVALLPKRAVKRIEEGRVVLDQPGAFSPHLSSVRIGPVDESRLEVDGVVLGIRRRPEDRLHEELRFDVENVILVGDAVEPRTVYEAVAEGSAAGRSVGGPRVHPTMPAQRKAPA
jgi:2,4-dienoyl-CoA reductase-like NADH-dependent reductase (Old Yellow Enzyme family)/thioredoxin reductase